jgi:rod shape-determining protein MreD
MKWLKISLIFIVVLFLQIFIVPNLTILESFPNFFLIILVLLCLTFRFDLALFWAIAGGLTMDLYSTWFFGFYTISFLFIYVILQLVLEKYFTEPVFLVIVLSFFLSSIFIEIWLYIFIYKGIIILALSASINAIFGTILYYLFSNKLKLRENIFKI